MRKNDYSWLTEADTTKSGTIELTEEEWREFFEFLDGGTVKDREESSASGDSGPWYYLYWKGDKGKCQEFSFISYEKEKEFETYCRGLSER